MESIDMFLPDIRSQHLQLGFREVLCLKVTMTIRLISLCRTFREVSLIHAAVQFIGHVELGSKTQDCLIKAVLRKVLVVHEKLDGRTPPIATEISNAPYIAVLLRLALV